MYIRDTRANRRLSLHHLSFNECRNERRWIVEKYFTERCFFSSCIYFSIQRCTRIYNRIEIIYMCTYARLHVHTYTRRKVGRVIYKQVRDTRNMIASRCYSDRYERKNVSFASGRFEDAMNDISFFEKVFHRPLVSIVPYRSVRNRKR